MKLAEITNTKWMKGQAKGIPQANEPLHENNQKKEVQDIPKSSAFIHLHQYLKRMQDKTTDF